MALHRTERRGRYTPTGGEQPMGEAASNHADALLEALRQQAEPDAHDRGLILERLAWTPEQRLEANAAFLRFYLAVRPDGPLIRDK